MHGTMARELYGNKKKTDYPPFMHYRHVLTNTAGQREGFWRDWGMDEGNATNNCRTTTITSGVNAAGTVQTVVVNATMLL